MPRGDAPTQRLGVGLFISLLFHAGLGAAVIGTPPVGRGALDRIADDSSEAERLPRPEVTLGEPDATTSSITWIGYEEYEEHMARLAETEQAAQSRAVAVPIPAAPPGQGQPAPAEVALEQPSPAPPAEPARQAVSPAAPTNPAAAAEAAQELSESLAGALSVARDEARLGMSVLADAASRLTAPIAAAIERGGATSREQRPESNEGEPPRSPDPPTGVAAQAPPAEETPPAAENAGGGRPAPPARALRLPSDREALATAIREAVVIRPGKPLAAKGLRIATTAPDVADVTYLMSQSRRDHVVRVFFGSDGKVKDAVTLRSSGYRLVDEAGLDAVFQWKAEGPQLESLIEEQGDQEATLPVDFRIVL